MADLTCSLLSWRVFQWRSVNMDVTLLSFHNHLSQTGLLFVAPSPVCWHNADITLSMSPYMSTIWHFFCLWICRMQRVLNVCTQSSQSLDWLETETAQRRISNKHVQWIQLATVSINLWSMLYVVKRFFSSNFTKFVYKQFPAFLYIFFINIIWPK